MRLIFLAMVAAFAAMASPAAAGPCEDFAKQLAVAPVNSTVSVPSGLDACNVTLKRPLTLDGSATSVVRTINIVNVTGATVQNLRVTLTPDENTVATTAAVRVASAKDVRLSNLIINGGLALASGTGERISGQPIGRAISLERSSNLVVDGCFARTFHKGITLYLVENVTIRRCDIGNVRTGTISGGALIGPILIEKNVLHDSNPVNYGSTGDHADFIHFWTDPRALTRPTDGVRIYCNLLDRNQGYPIMGIYIDDNRNGIGFIGVVIEKNVVLSGHAQGILLERTQGIVSQNMLLQSGSWRGTDPRDAPAVSIDAVSQVDVIRNLAADPYGTFARAPAANDNFALPGGIRPEGELQVARWTAKAC